MPFLIFGADPSNPDRLPDCVNTGERDISFLLHTPLANPFSSSSSCICYLAHDTKINMTASVVVSSTIRPKLGQSHDWSYQIFQSFFFLCQNHHHQPPIQSNYLLPWQCDAVKLNKKCCKRPPDRVHFINREEEEEEEGGFLSGRDGPNI